MIVLKAKVNKEGCIGCGMCVSICPDVFDFDTEGKAQAVDEEVSEKYINDIKEARDSCPVSVIDVK